MSSTFPAIPPASSFSRTITTRVLASPLSIQPLLIVRGNASLIDSLHSFVVDPLWSHLLCVHLCTSRGCFAYSLLAFASSGVSLAPQDNFGAVGGGVKSLRLRGLAPSPLILVSPCPLLRCLWCGVVLVSFASFFQRRVPFVVEGGSFLRFSSSLQHHLSFYFSILFLFQFFPPLSFLLSTHNYAMRGPQKSWHNISTGL